MTGLTVPILVAVALIALAIIIAYIVKYVPHKPTLVKDWSPDQAIMPGVEFADDGKILIKNIRNINYRTTRDYDLGYYDKQIKLEDVTSAWLAISPFGGPGAAHAFLSFGLNDDSFIAVSIEIRRRKGQRFSPVKAFLRQFEIMYVIAAETDVIRVRTNCARYTVRLFPVQTEKHLIRSVFLDVLKRADSLGKEPEFYNTLWNNCTTNIIKHTRKFSAKPIPFWNIRYLFPETLDKIAYRLNIIDTHLSYDAAREHFDITQHARNTDEDSDFSTAIRNHLSVRPVD